MVNSSTNLEKIVKFTLEKIVSKKNFVSFMAPSMRGNLLVVCNCNNLFEVVDNYSFFFFFFFFWGLSLAFLSEELVAVECTAFVNSPINIKVHSHFV
jgi:hypothetical protein